MSGSGAASGSGGVTGVDVIRTDTIGTGGAAAPDARIDAAAGAGGTGATDASADTRDGDTAVRDARDTEVADSAGGPRDGGIDPIGASAVRIIATHSDKCMGVDANGTADGTRIYQFACAAATGQVFRFEALGGAVYRIINQSSGKCVSASGTGNSATLHISACNGGATQSYTLQTAGANYNIVNTGAANCVEVAQQSTADGAAYRYFTCGGGSHQVFRFEAP
jgi:hypothetical protein